MADRTIRLHGIGFDETPATVTITLDGAEVYNGAIFSTSEPPTYDLSDKLGEILANPFYTFTKDHTFSGSLDLTITATKGDVMYTHARSNYMPISHLDSPTDYFTSGDEGWVACYYTDFDGGVLRDPNTEVSINGVARERDPSLPNAKYGQWWWYIPEGETLACKLNISAGIMDPIHIGTHVTAEAEYTGDGVNTTFAVPTEPTGILDTVVMFVDGVELATGTYEINEEGTTMTAHTAPADGSIVAIKRIEIFDDGFKTYANFELLPS